MRVGLIAKIMIIVLLIATVNFVEADEISLDIYPKGDSEQQINPASIILNGYIYPDGWWFSQIDAKLFVPTDVELFLMNVFKTNKSGTQQDIINLWAPDEQLEIGTLLSDIELYKSNRNYLNNVSDSAYLVRIYYGKYEILLIQNTHKTYGDIVNFYVATKIDNKYYLTNKLKSDIILKTIINEVLPSLKLKPLQQGA